MAVENCGERRFKIEKKTAKLFVSKQLIFVNSPISHILFLSKLASIRIFTLCFDNSLTQSPISHSISDGFYMPTKWHKYKDRNQCKNE